MERQRVLLFSTLAALVFCALMIPTFAAHQSSIPTHINGSFFRRGFEVRSSSPDSILITYSLQDLGLIHRGGRKYNLALAGSERLGTNNAPDLPVFRKLVAIPEGGDVRVHARQRVKTRIEDIDVSLFVRGKDDHWLEQGSTTVDNQPLQVADIEYVGHLRGQRVAYVRVAPARYDPNRRVMDIATDFEIVVTVDSPQGPVCRRVGPLEAVASGHILNFDTKNALATRSSQQLQLTTSGQVCWCTGSTWQTTAASAAACEADYLIVVADPLASSSYVQTLRR